MGLIFYHCYSAWILKCNKSSRKKAQALDLLRVKCLLAQHRQN